VCAWNRASLSRHTCCGGLPLTPLSGLKAPLAGQTRSLLKTFPFKWAGPSSRCLCRRVQLNFTAIIFIYPCLDCAESVVWSELLTINDSDHKDKQPPAPLYFDGESRQMSNVIVGRNDSGGVALCDALVVHNHLPVELALYLSGSLGQSHIHTIAARGGRLIPTEALGEESVIWFIPIASKWWVCSRRIRLHKIASWSVHLRDANSGAAILAMLSVASSPAGGLVVDIREHFDPPLLIKNASTVQLYLLTKPAGSSPASASSPVVSLPPDSSVPFDFAAFELEATPFLLISLSA